MTLASTRGDLARAILEGIALDLKGGVEVLEEITGLAESYPAAFEQAIAACPQSLFEPDEANCALYEGLRKKALALYAALSTPETRRLLAEAK